MQLLFATGNENKVKEVKTALKDKNISIKQKNVDIEEIESHDVEKVALRKAKDSAAAIKAENPVLVDDTGLYVKSLNGFPGAHASYILSTIGIDGLLELMEKKDDRKAYFKSTMAIHYPDGETTAISGTCEGNIARKESGTDGFGYDTIFIPKGNNKTFAADIEYKNTVSHRVEAIEKLVTHLSN